MGTLLVMDPAFTRTPEKEFLNGELAAGRKVVRVWTDNWNISNGSAFPLSGGHGGAIHYRNALKKYQGTPADPTVTLTHSRGGEVAMKTIREWSQWLIDNGVNPACHKIYMCGCPEIKFTGASYVRPTVDKAVYPGALAHNFFCPTPSAFHGGYGVGFGLPATMIWPVECWCVIQEFDGYADCPAGTNAEVARYFIPGKIGPSRTGTTSPHISTNPGNYRKSLSDSTNVPYTDPVQTNVHYLWLRSDRFPSMPTQAEAANANRNEYTRIWPIAMPAYSNRPVTLPILTA